MDKQQIYEFLTSKNIEYEITDHKAVFNMSEVAEIELPHPEADAKNIFVRDDRKENYYMITVRGDKRVDLKAFRKMLGARPLSFVSESDLMKILNLIPGAVTPLGLLNDDSLKVQLFIDSEFRDVIDFIGVHPNDNTATIWLKVTDLIDVISEHGNEVHLIDI